MNVSAVSPLAKRSQDFSTLQATLQTGNIAAAQGAFASLLQDVQNVSTTAGPTGLFAPGSQANKDLMNLGGALKSSDLSGARTAFAALQQDLQSAAPSHIVSSGAHGHRPLSHVDIASNSSVPLQTISQSSLAKSIGGVLNQKA